MANKEFAWIDEVIEGAKKYDREVEEETRRWDREVVVDEED